MVARLKEIQQKISLNQFELTKHAVDQTVLRDITIAEIREAILRRSEVIEDYPEDKYGPSCLIYGLTASSRPLHILCSYPNRPLIKIITVYQPDEELWINFRIRKRSGKEDHSERDSY